MQFAKLKEVWQSAMLHWAQMHNYL